MKFKKLVCMGMAAVLVCSNLPQTTVQAQQIQEEAVGDIQSEEEKKRNPEEISLAQEEEKKEHSEVIRGEEAAREGTKEEFLEQEIKQQDLQNLEIEPKEEMEKVNPSQEEQWYENFQYQELADGTLRITDYKEDRVKEVIIPAEIEGKKVTSIGDYAFSGQSSLDSISVPDGIISIGEGAFYNCPKGSNNDSRAYI